MPKANDLEIYPFDPLIDPRDGVFGFDWNNAKRNRNFKMEHLRHFILQGLDPSNNGFITTTGYTLVGNLLTINAGWVWQLNGMLFTNEEEVEFPLEYTAEGFVRIDSIYANANNTFGIISGQESETIAVPPAIPVNTLLALSVNVFDTTIVGGEGPVLGASYVKKSFANMFEFNGSGAGAIIPLHPSGYSEIRLINAGLTSVSGVDLSLMTGPNFELPYQGKDFLFWNRTGSDITLNHEDFATADLPLFIRQETNIIFPQNHAIVFRYDSGGLYEIDKTWNITDDVTGLPAVLDLKADLVDGKVPSEQLPSYVDDVLEFANKAYFPVSGEASKIYLALDTNFTYRWTGSVYTKISDTGKLDKVTTVDVEKVYIKNADGTQGMKPTSELLSEILITNPTVTGSYAIDWTNDVWDLTLTGNTTLTETNLPASGKTKTITLNISGNHTLTYPSGWTSKITGAYIGTATLNTITIQYYGSGKYKVLIVQPS